MEENSNQHRVKLNYLEEWVNVYSNINNNRYKRKWKEIGEEVLNRKSLFIAAIKDLDENKIIGDIQNLAATDVFVEKATKIITKRAYNLLILGAIVSFLILVLLCYAGHSVKETNIAEDVINYKINYINGIAKDSILKMTFDKNIQLSAKEFLLKPIELDGYTFTVLLFKKISFGAFFIALSVFLAYIARALFHEGFMLYSKRHSLRFGRLYVYIKKGHVNFKELEEAFQWNKEFPTAFKDIRPDLISKSILNVFPEITKHLAEAVKSYAEVLKEKKTIINNK